MMLATGFLTTLGFFLLLRLFSGLITLFTGFLIILGELGRAAGFCENLFGLVVVVLVVVLVGVCFTATDLLAIFGFLSFWSLSGLMILFTGFRIIFGRLLFLGAVLVVATP